MKLNVKRTVLVGLAFLTISAFWQMYDFTIPLVLKNTYALGDTWSGVVMSMDNILALFLLPFFGALSDKCTSRMGRRMPFIVGGTAAAVLILCFLPAVIARGTLTVFLLCLGLLLVAMGVYRSPAVALMPDVTPKPLRSKGNAIINLMGALGGVLILALVRVAVVYRTDPSTGNTVSDYSYLLWATAAIMAVGIAVMFLTVREPKLTAQMPPEEADEETAAAPGGKLRPEVRRSLLFLLAAVALWYMGYNAVTTAFSKYAIACWGAAEGAAATCLLVGTGAAVLSYIPVGIISSKLGRKKVILGGVLLLGACFLAAALLPGLNALMYAVFIVVGFAWAAINVNSYPMVVEMAAGADTGRYTGYYYTFSMSAQVLTPILSGFLMEKVGYATLFPYAAVCAAGAFAAMLLVKHGDSKPEAKRGLEALDVDD